MINFAAIKGSVTGGHVTGGQVPRHADFQVDKTDVRLALRIAKAQLAFQEFYCKSILEKYYDNKATELASNVRHQQRTLLAYRRLPNPFTSEDVKREYGYDSVGSVCSRLKHLCDDGLAKKIRKGPDKGKYQNVGIANCEHRSVFAILHY